MIYIIQYLHSCPLHLLYTCIAAACLLGFLPYYYVQFADFILTGSAPSAGVLGGGTPVTPRSFHDLPYVGIPIANLLAGIPPSSQYCTAYNCMYNSQNQNWCRVNYIATKDMVVVLYHQLGRLIKCYMQTVLLLYFDFSSNWFFIFSPEKNHDIDIDTS